MNWFWTLYYKLVSRPSGPPSILDKTIDKVVGPLVK